MNNKKTIPFILSLLLAPIIPTAVFAMDLFNHHLYVGILGGAGSTTWEGLVPSKLNQNDAVMMSTPIDVQEGGGVFGALVGYEFSPFFALEANYAQYPRAGVTFDEMSLFTFNNEGLAGFVTDTETLSLMAKIMLLVPKTKVRFYSGAGLVNIHRQDMVLNEWRLGPTFSVGVNYPLTDHLKIEFDTNYAAGYGESQLNPADAYFPFLYSGTFRLAYYF